jgi:hypothetical protein
VLALLRCRKKTFPIFLVFADSWSYCNLRVYSQFGFSCDVGRWWRIP